MILCDWDVFLWCIPLHDQMIVCIVSMQWCMHRKWKLLEWQESLKDCKPSAHWVCSFYWVETNENSADHQTRSSLKVGKCMYTIYTFTCYRYVFTFCHTDNYSDTEQNEALEVCGNWNQCDPGHNADSTCMHIHIYICLCGSVCVCNKGCNQVQISDISSLLCPLSAMAVKHHSSPPDDFSAAFFVEQTYSSGI